ATLIGHREPAAIEMRLLFDSVPKLRLLRALLEGIRAARPELAALGKVDQRRRHPLDRIEALLLRTVEARDRAEQPPCVRVLPVVKELPSRRALDDAAGVHD